MLKTGDDHLRGLRDGRVVYLGSERIDDVTTHPAFSEAARTVARMYDLKRSTALLDVCSYKLADERHSAWWLPAKTKDDLRLRMQCSKAVADMTYGMMGRTPDHVNGFVTGMITDPTVFNTEKYKFSENIVRYYDYCRDRDLFLTNAVLPPQAARDPDYYTRKNLPVPTLKVIRETDDGIVIDGMKMLASSAVLGDEIWIGNLLPLAPNQTNEGVTCAIPVNAEGLRLWSRQPLSRNTPTEFDGPLAWRFDETDSMVMCKEVKVPWERVFVFDDSVLPREIYIRTAAHNYGNNQSNVRFLSKLQLIVGVCSKIACSSGANEVPAVREVLGRMAALEALLSGAIHGQIEAAEEWPAGYMVFNRRMLYAALNWCTEMYSPIIDQLRELCGGGVFQLPANATVMHDTEMREEFEKYWQTPQMAALDRMKLFKLAWDLVGSEFAGRQQQYEKFYAGAAFIVRGHNYREADWDFFHGIVDKLMNSYDVSVGDCLDQKRDGGDQR